MAKKLAFDKALFTVVVGLVIFGLVMVFSASAPRGRGLAVSDLFTRQALAALVGLAAMSLVMHVDYRHWRRRPVIYALLGGSLALLVAVLFEGDINGSRRWIRAGALSVQPSEIAKLALIPFVAYQIDKREEDINRLEFFLPVGFFVLLTAALVLIEPDMGTAVMLVAASAVMVFLAGLSWKIVAFTGLAGAGALGLLVAAVDYRRNRFLAFLDPESDPLGHGYQALQSLIAIGSGGLFGLGQGAGLQKLYYLPLPESDFIFSIVSEELGLLGALGVLAAFAVLLWRGVRAGRRAPDTFGRYLAFGITFLLVGQALINIGVAVSVLPTKGIPLPFISYGGTSLVVALTLAGILLNVSEHG